MNGPSEQQIVLPREAARLLADMLAELANGTAVSLVPLQTEFTTQQAADLLGVSRPYLVALLEEGQIAHRRVGNRRRVPVGELLRYKDVQDARSRAAVAALTEEAAALGSTATDPFGFTAVDDANVYVPPCPRFHRRKQETLVHSPT